MGSGGNAFASCVLATFALFSVAQLLYRQTNKVLVWLAYGARLAGAIGGLLAGAAAINTQESALMGALAMAVTWFALSILSNSVWDSTEKP